LKPLELNWENYNFRRRSGSSEYVFLRLGHQGHQPPPSLCLQHVCTLTLLLLAGLQTVRLPSIKTCCQTPNQYFPLRFGEGVKIAHFIGPNKPWSQYFDSETKQVRPSPTSGHLKYLFQFWWDLFCAHVHPHLSPDMVSCFALITVDPYIVKYINKRVYI
jgi:hypothetical protein